ncbi:Amt family ammonium transporter [Amycolatopsis bartoniae]|uniref:Ammonium transporter n=1 Tax=Amycolatopsis bartoniae TaxID=941986 RepID=A0A8H9MB50_9PSEU|nr:ammonium transporter [Amycolatopsis bartoniae]MBB2940293.1 Amt family ammonium transporter [Amycolatopsis bartoniae]TVT09485.1 ammonium transporter [Amycolatopsis bartoniae]GHF53441.1 ammonium transporter [Amycolatopsis bartoniae]
MIDTGDTAWLLVSAALVMLMTPGLALFYGGMVRSRSVLNVMMLTFVCLAVVGVVWLLYGYSLAFGDSLGGFVGDLRFAGLHGAGAKLVGPAGHQVPLLAFAAFQLMFAVITVALLVGAVAERARFWPWLVFVVGWVTLVYLPLAHWVFAFDGFSGPGMAGGWLVNKLHALDFAGGTAVEVNSGAAAVALALVVGRRHGWPRQPVRPHNLPFVMLGAGLLWFGWFGFNAGSALAANGVAATSFVNTTVAAGTGVLGWLVIEQARDGKPTTLGAASGAVAGLVGITPGCGYVEPLGAAAIGLVAGVVCSLAIGLKYKLGLDDSLDVLAVHGIGGFAGLLLVGLFATKGANDAGADGLFYGGGLDQLWRQAVAAVAALGYSLAVTFVLAWIIHRALGLRADRESELDGIDEAEHAESAYDLAVLPSRRGTGAEQGVR